MVKNLFKKILVPYDGSKLSTRAFKMALDLAKKTHGQITVLECIDVDFSATLMPHADFDFGSIILKKLRAKSKDDIKELEKLAKKKKIPFKSKIIDSNSTVNSILSFSKSQKVDLILMAAHSRSTVSEFFLGSVSHGVVHNSKIPVLIVR